MGHGEKGRSGKRQKSSKDDYRSPIAEEDEAICGEYGEEMEDDYRDGDGEGKKKDFSKLELKPDHGNRPLVRMAGWIFLETCSPLYKQAYDFLIAPVCRLESTHEYNLTPQSLYASVSVGVETETIISVLNKLSKTKLPKEMIDFIHASTANYGKVKLVLKKIGTSLSHPFLRLELMHEYNLTPQSLYVAVSVGVETETIISILNKLSKTKLPKEMIDFINACIDC